jgi:hypothetical protein
MVSNASWVVAEKYRPPVDVETARSISASTPFVLLPCSLGVGSGWDVVPSVEPTPMAYTRTPRV